MPAAPDCSTTPVSAVLQRVRAEILSQLWPPLEQHLLPLLHQASQPNGAFPLASWPDPSANGLPSLRISDMFVRRYARPPKGSPGRRDRSLHRWSSKPKRNLPLLVTHGSIKQLRHDLCMTTRTIQTWLHSDRLLVSTVPQHQDASELSVSIELSAPESYEGGLCKFTRELLLLVTYGYMPIDCLL